MKMLGYRDRPAEEWTPLFWSILRRKIVDIQRRGNFRLRFFAPSSERSEDSMVDWADSAAGPSRSHDQREAYSRLTVALRTLPARQREAFTLRVLEELDVADTARAMGCSEGSVKTHLSRARGALQKQMEDSDEDGDRSKGSEVDQDMRQLHATAVSSISPQTLARLRAARHAAQATPRHGHAWRWITATAFSAVLAVTLGVQLLPGSGPLRTRSR